MKISSIVRQVFYWMGMLAAGAMLFVVPYFKMVPVNHGQTMGGAIGAALAPVVYWVLLASIVQIAPIIAFIAARMAGDPPEVRRHYWRPMLVGIATSILFWVMFWMGLK